ncbi:MAG: hypothetical protein M3063_12450 [Actinomycetota bacterium]|nr:hypothetical protein [Actinomycetota bacterium]
MACPQLTVGSAAPTDAELYDPRRGTWSPTGATQFDRGHPVAVLLRTGRVLVTGLVSGRGNGATPGELYDSARGTWSPTGNAEPVPNSDSPATVLADGRVLVVEPAPFGGSMIYDPVARPDPANPSVKGGTWVRAAPILGGGAATATRLRDGKVMVTGGKAFPAVLRSTASSPRLSTVAELYNEKTGSWSFAATTTGGRRDFAVSPEGGPSGFTATLLKDGTVLVVGGSVKVDASPSMRDAGTVGPSDPANYGPSAELFTPGDNDGSGSNRPALLASVAPVAVVVVAVAVIARRRRQSRPR